jgi:HEAT repeat protein
MGFFKRLFSGDEGPSAGQIKRALKQVIQIHGDASVRVAAMERLADWRTPEAATTLLRRFTVQVPQASMDHEEKQYTVRLLVRMGRVAVEPILSYLQTEGEVTWPVRALREILPQDEYVTAVRAVLEKLSSGYTRWPEAKAVIIAHIPKEAYPQVAETMLTTLQDDDDDVCIAAIDYLARSGDEAVRERLIETLLEADARPRVRGRIFDQLCEHEWPVKGYRKRVEEILQEPYYLTAKGTVKRRSVPA